MSYGPHYANLFRRAADMVDKILRGTKPGDISVEQPSKFELVINLETAKALCIVTARDRPYRSPATIPELYLERNQTADSVEHQEEERRPQSGAPRRVSAE
jgi:ABC-type uncharacterized transport system substrate-binding protein